MIQSINFEVKKWQHNPNAPLIKPNTDTQLETNPIRKKQSTKAEGIGFKWTYVLHMDGIERIYYLSEEMVLIPDSNISDNELLSVVKSTYDKSYAELIKRNLSVGIYAGFIRFEEVPFDLSELRKVLTM